jgi:prophage DNA circulation protein
MTISLYPASFKGARFFYTDGDVSSGRKTAVHDYVNQDIRVVEDLGLNPRTFSIRGIVSGITYRQQKAELEDKLTQEGSGILVHPFLGNVRVTSTGYTVSEPLSERGIARFSMNFVETSENIFPKIASDNITKIAELYNTFYSFISADLNKQYLIASARNVSSGAEKLQDLSGVLNDIFDVTRPTGTAATNYKKEERNFSGNTYKIAAQDGDIGGRISDLIFAFDNVSDDSQARFDASKTIVGFGEEEFFRRALTVSANNRVNNDKLINGTVNLLALNNMIDAAKNIEYTDEDQLNDIVKIIDEKFDEINNATYLDFSNQAASDIAELRNESRIFFEQKRLTVNKIIEIETQTIPAAILAFNQYGSTGAYDEILKLNNISNPAVVSGKVKIVEA